MTETSQRTETDRIRQRVPHINHPACKKGLTSCVDASCESVYIQLHISIYQ